MTHLFSSFFLGHHDKKDSVAVSVLEERRAMGRDGVGCETQAEYLPFTLASYVSIYYF